MPQLSRATCLLVIGVAALVSTAMAEERHPLVPAARRAVDPSRLREIERRVLPPVLVPGPAQHETLPAYYWAANQDLRARFERARSAYEAGDARPYRALTLVAGAAGIGKSFLKGDVFRKDYPPEAVCKFDIKELYATWMAEGRVIEKPDLQCGSLTLNRMLSLTHPERRDIARFLESQPAAFYLIDSLDEIHPNDHLPVLEQIEQFALAGSRNFVHVVVFGRSLAFCDYWHRKAKGGSNAAAALFVLNPPVFRTTGDLRVSSWNYHSWKYRLQWAPDGSERTCLPLAAYAEWSERGYPHSGPFATVSCLANTSLMPRVRDALSACAQSQPVVGGTLYNLAGNSMSREIIEEFALAGRAFDELSFMAAYLQKWLERETASDNRPSARQPEYLDLYLRLLQEVAVRVLAEDRVDDYGCFVLLETETVEIDYQGQRLVFPVKRVLERSGLKHFDPRQPGPPKYHFEPIWMHRLLVEMHNDRVRRAADVTAMTDR
jgi:hypothetical protein